MPRIDELDGVRAVAVLIVFLSHLGPLHRLVPGGLGVTIFFFLSGYLITSLLRVEAGKNGRIDFAGFYLRRTLRIFPPLYITLAASAILLSLGMLTVTNLDTGSVLSQMFFLSNYERLWGPHNGLPGPPLWSLAVEEHFYLLFPLLFSLVLLRMSPRRASAWCAAACILPLVARIVPLLAGSDITLNYYFSHTRADSILAGCCLALWNNPIFDKGAWQAKLPHFILGCSLIIGAALVSYPPFAEVFRYTVQNLGLYLVFSFILTPRDIISPLLLWKPLRIIGVYSYTIYLSQIIALKLAERLLPGSSVVTISITGAVITLFYAMLMNVAVEKPIARLRHRRQAIAGMKRSVGSVDPSRI